MADKLAIINLALAHLGEPQAPDLNPDAMREATRKVVAAYDQGLAVALCRTDWLCARDYATLTPAAEPGSYAYAYIFLLPPDALRVVRVDTARVKWERGSRQDEAGAVRQIIRADAAGPLDVCFTRLVEPAAMDPLLVDVVALDVAARACTPVNGDQARADRLAEAAERRAWAAQSADGMQEGGQDPWIESDFEQLRRSAL